MKTKPIVAMSFPDFAEPIVFQAISAVISDAKTNDSIVMIHTEDQLVESRWLVRYIAYQIQRQMDFFDEEDETKRVPYKFDMTVNSVGLSGCFVSSINFTEMDEILSTPVHMEIQILFDERKSPSHL